MSNNYSIPSMIRVTSNQNLRNIFIFFSILAFVLLIFLYLMPEGPLKMTLAIGTPLVIMIAYGAIVLNKGRNVAPYDVLGDSIYYLGFLITLFALVLALLAAGGTTDQAFNKVLPQFAIALISTVVGLFARVVVAQFSSNDEDLLEVSEKSLVDSATAFRAELDISLETYKNFTTRVEKEVQEIVQNSTIQLTTFFEKNSEEFSEKSIKVLDALALSSETLNKKTQQIETSLDLLNKGISDFNNNLGSADKEILSLKNTFSELSNNFVNNNMLEDLKNFPKAINEYTENIESIKKLLLQDSELISNMKDDIQNNLQKSNEAMISVHDNMLDAARVVVEKLKK